uniref:Putative tumor necrosis factor receptor n=1 Tax=Ixodes ricinus TaxID=34613 RepID=V5HQY5_IXORI
MLKISYHLSGLHTSVKECQEDVEECREDAREAAKNTKEQLEALSSRLSEQLVRVVTRVFAAASKELKVAIEDTMETHMAQELGAQSEELMNVMKSVSDCVLGFRGAKEFHWYFKSWERSKDLSFLTGRQQKESPFLYVYGYNVCICSYLDINRLYVCLCIQPGVNDSKLEWPFSKSYKLAVIHPKDKAKSRSFKFDASKYSDNPTFQMPKQGGNNGFGTTLSTANGLELEGFVNDDSLHFFLQVEP